MKQKNLLIAAFLILIGAASATAASSNTILGTHWTDGTGRPLTSSQVLDCDAQGIFCANAYTGTQFNGAIQRAD